MIWEFFLILQVYDVTSFMDDHPGGDEVMVSSTGTNTNYIVTNQIVWQISENQQFTEELCFAGKDATNDFEDVGHSETARNMLDKYYIGDVDPLTFKATYAPVLARKAPTDDNRAGFMVKILQLLVPIVILGLAIVVRNFTKVEQ